MEIIEVVARDLIARKLLWERVAYDADFNASVVKVAVLLIDTLKSGKRVFVCGNGGSAAESQHFAAELVGRFGNQKYRRALPVMSLTTDTSILTAMANDDGYQSVFSRQIEAHAQAGDVLLAMTTSDYRPHHSENILQGLQAAWERGCKIVLLGSKKTVQLLPRADITVLVPDGNTSHIQEVHLAVLHIISGLVEEAFLPA